MISISNKVLRFIDNKPKWWVPGTMIGSRNNKDTKGAFLLYRTLYGKPAINEDYALNINLPDGMYQVLEHGKESIMIIPDPDYQQPEDFGAKRVPMPAAPDWETCSDADLALYKLKTGQALQSQGRFSGGFPGWCDAMDKSFAIYKLNRKSVSKLPVQRTEVDYYDELMKIIGDQSVSDTVKIRALKELQAAKPRENKERKIRRIVIPD